MEKTKVRKPLLSCVKVAKRFRLMWASEQMLIIMILCPLPGVEVERAAA